MRFKTNVQNICKLQSFTNKLDITTMRKLFLLLVLAIFYSCEKNELNDCFGKIIFSAELYLNNPEFFELENGRGWVITSKKGRNLLILKSGISPTYKAFDLECPNNDCTTPMIFDGSLKMKCSCDQSEYSIYDGAPQNNGANCSAYEYNARLSNTSTLIITNF
ncbi:MAG: hypothetical protein ACYC01_13315 [Lutibacter sp.]